MADRYRIAVAMVGDATGGPTVILDGDHDVEPDEYCHPGTWPTRAEAEAALDRMAWCAFPYVCMNCLKTRTPAVGTGLPPTWAWDKPGSPNARLLCGACKEG